MKISFVSLGCPKNRVDSERLIGTLLRAGCELSKDGEILIINTCAFIEPAVKESIDEILSACREKKEGKLKKIVVVGCLVERYGEKALKRLIPEVDLFLGVIKDPTYHAQRILGRKVDKSERFITTGFYAYIKIGEGCSRRCSFCLIPKIRGRGKSIGMDEIKKEVDGLPDEIKEIILVSQDLTSYRDKGKNLASLIKEINNLGKYRWVRLLYLHPAGINDELLYAIGDCEKVVRYFDMPIQHVSDDILKNMKRGYRRKDVERIYSKIRKMFPDAILRTTVMVGFPGEGKKEFNELVSFLKDYPFEYLGGFTYFDEEGSKSKNLKNKVGKKEKEKRLEMIYEMQMGITEKLLKRFRGKTLEVFNDGESFRFYGQAPEIDGCVRGDLDIEPGGFAWKKIVDIDGYDLIA